MFVSSSLAATAAVIALSPLANAEPPNCTSADLEGVRAGVDASTSAYLFTHPDLNGFMSTLQGLSREQVADRTTAWLSDHPQEKAEMAGIRQPLLDLKNRCGAIS
ncbi:heme-binding protein [Mycolicibacterium rutilum]|nr:heme-binding protein [Mycolicibacterium rutilum]